MNLRAFRDKVVESTPLGAVKRFAVAGVLVGLTASCGVSAEGSAEEGDEFSALARADAALVTFKASAESSEIGIDEWEVRIPSENTSEIEGKRGNRDVVRINIRQDGDQSEIAASSASGQRVSLVVTKDGEVLEVNAVRAS